MSAVAVMATKACSKNKLLWKRSQYLMCVCFQNRCIKIFDTLKNLSGKRDAFVLIGHPKSLQNKNLFDDFITTAKERNTNYQFKTLTEYYNTIKKEHR